MKIVQCICICILFLLTAFINLYAGVSLVITPDSEKAAKLAIRVSCESVANTNSIQVKLHVSQKYHRPGSEQVLPLHSVRIICLRNSHLTLSFSLTVDNEMNFTLPQSYFKQSRIFITYGDGHSRCPPSYNFTLADFVQD